jgi:hypothetical protein
MCSALYKDNFKQYVENKYVVESTGWKPLAETINGRAAMLVSRITRLVSGGGGYHLSCRSCMLDSCYFA